MIHDRLQGRVVQHLGPFWLAARAMIVREATKRFGEAPESAAALEAIEQLDELEGIAQRVFVASDWADMVSGKKG